MKSTRRLETDLEPDGDLGAQLGSNGVLNVLGDTIDTVEVLNGDAGNRSNRESHLLLLGKKEKEKSI